MGKKQKYFEKRSLEDSKRVINLTEKYINQQLRKYYKLAVKEVQQQIKDFYKKYAKGENITLAEAKKQLKEVELKNIDLEKLVLETKQNSTKDMIKLINKIIKQQQISRLELLEIEIQRILRNLFNEQQISMYDYLYDTYKDSYYRSTYSLKDYNNIYTTFVKPNESLIKQAIMQKWSSKNYSERIWNHENKINEILKQHITTGLIQGNSISKMSQKVTNDMNVSLNNSIRLVRTETAYIQGKAILESYIQAGIKKYKYLATLDYKTSKVCQNLDSKIFEVEKAQIGTNYPPMHPNCRSTTVVYIDDNVESERIARGTDNKTYKVSADITYKEWYNSLVEDEQSKMILYLRRQKNYAQDVKQFENYKKVLKTKSPSSFEKFQKIKYQDDDKWDKLKSEYRLKLRGLGSNNNSLGDGIKHDSPKLLEKLDKVNDDIILSKLKEYEKIIVKDDIKENAIVITRDGEVWQCFGIIDKVFPDIDLEDKLYGASVTHNHPSSATNYSFSSADLDLFLNYDLKLLRGCDYKYKYSVERTSNTIKEDCETIIHKFKSDYYYEVLERVMSGEIEIGIYDEFHYINEQFSKHNNFIYKRSEW